MCSKRGVPRWVGARDATSREVANAEDSLELLGLDHVTVQAELARWASLAPDQLGAAVSADVSAAALLTVWRVEVSVDAGQRRLVLQPICMTPDGVRLPTIERRLDQVFGNEPRSPCMAWLERRRVVNELVEPALQRELALRAGRGNGGYAAELLACVELVPEGR